MHVLRSALAEFQESLVHLHVDISVVAVYSVPIREIVYDAVLMAHSAVLVSFSILLVEVIDSVLVPNNVLFSVLAETVEHQEVQHMDRWAMVAHSAQVPHVLFPLVLEEMKALSVIFHVRVVVLSANVVWDSDDEEYPVSVAHLAPVVACDVPSV